MYEIEQGVPQLGCSLDLQGANFGIFSDKASSMLLEIYHSSKEELPVFKMVLDRVRHATGDIFHIYIKDIQEGMGYIWKTIGSSGNLSKEIIDPYAYCIEKKMSKPLAYKNIVANKNAVWHKKPCIPWEETILYEMHLGGFTKHTSSDMAICERGTYQGVVNKIPYLKELGVTTVELLPVFKWHEQVTKNKNPLTGELLKDVWGYNPISFFALDEKYSVQKNSFEAIQEFKNFVKTMHDHGLEIILDVVYNHTGESGLEGEAFHFKYLSNNTYYRFDENGCYLNHSGTGNTLNTNHNVVKTLILESLRYWVVHMGVDGFRFDLASILGQDKTGRWMTHSILDDICEDPILSHVKLISESWDAGGSYDVGKMPYCFREWSDAFRDTARRFVRGDMGLIAPIAACLLGEEIEFSDLNKNSTHAIHFITAHDGFTLWDLVAYNEKNNIENGENNRDGHNANYSNNCGIEGETQDVSVLNLRKRRLKNYMCLLLFSKGVPMLLMGDEMCRTQAGNNNAYCQDHEKIWLDWDRKDVFQDIFSFVKEAIRIRKAIKYFHTAKANKYKVTWHGVRYNKPDWSYYSKSLAAHIIGEGEAIYMIVNSYEEPLTFELPQTQGAWYRIIDTNLNSPKDAKVIGDRVEDNRYRVACFSVCVFVEDKK
jgi:glycogen operon protein